MEKTNVREYELIRKETEFIRDCITTYIGYAISGSGAALFGLAALRVFGTENRIIMAYVAMTLAVLLSLVLALLIYKFNSHNRYVGYARVITDETHSRTRRKPKHDGAHTAWEVCMDGLRMINNDATKFGEMARKVKIGWVSPEERERALNWMLNNYVGGPGAPRADFGRTRKGLQQLRLALLGRSKTNSWAFPPHVVAIFFMLTSLYVCIGAYCVFGLWIDGSLAPEISGTQAKVASFDYRVQVMYATAIAIVGMLLYLWRAFCRRLCLLMEGSATVDSFTYHFMIIRASFLNGLGITPSYPSIEKLMIAESENRTERPDRESINIS